MATTVADGLAWMFGGDIPRQALALGQVAARAAVVYLIGLALVRIGKSYLLGHATPVDLILAFLLGSLLSHGITGSAAISSTAVASAVLVAIHFAVTAWACHSRRVGFWVKGHRRVLVRDGVINWANMRRSNISEEDLLEEMWLNANIEDLSQVKVAYKERTGRNGPPCGASTATAGDSRNRRRQSRTIGTARLTSGRNTRMPCKRRDEPCLTR